VNDLRASLLPGGARDAGPSGAAAAPGEQVRSSRGRANPPGKGQKIMVVEDDYFVALDTSDTLEDAGYAVVAVVARGEDALAGAADHDPVLAVLDITLAGKIDGIETALALRERGVAVIFATAHTDRELMMRGRAAGPRAWLIKPFGQDALLHAVADALDALGS